MKYLFAVLVSCHVLSAHAVPFEGHKMMFAGPSPFAAETARKVYEDGGNLIDAAVAAALTLSVTSPYYSSLGGGGFAVVHFNGETKSLDFREVAPAATHPQFFVTNKNLSSLRGGAAVGVPGIVSGLWNLHQKWGKKKWASLFDDAIYLAEHGFLVSGEWQRSALRMQKDFNESGSKYFFRKDKSPYLPGQNFKQPQLAKALKLVRDKGADGFYKGDIPQDIVASTASLGGVLSETDFANYKSRWLEPLKTQFKDYELALMPPPSSGGVVIKTALHLTERLKLEKQQTFSVTEFHLIAEILSRSFRGRVLLGDPDFSPNPLSKLFSDKYLNTLSQSISPNKTSLLKPIDEKAFKESTETTHFSLMDHLGNAIAFTETLNGNFGSGVVSDKFGIALNNEMDDFTTKPDEPNMFGLIQGLANSVEPGKRPLSSMSPTIVFKDGKPVMSLGGVGGPKIISNVYQTLYRALVSKLDMDQAIQSPRLHHQYMPNAIYVWQNSFQPATIEGLKSRGHKVELSNQPHQSTRIFGILRRTDGIFEGAYDSQGEGAALGF